MEQALYVDKNIKEMVEYNENWLEYCWYYWNVEKDRLQVECNWKVHFSSRYFLLSTSIFVVSMNWSMKKETIQDHQLLAKNSMIVIYYRIASQNEKCQIVQSSVEDRNRRRW